MDKHPITLWREANDKTQAELGTAINVSRWTINSIELGRRSPSLDLAKRLASHTGLSLEQVSAVAPAKPGVAA